MKKLLLSTVAVSVMAGSAIAADLPYRRAAPAPAFVAVPVFTWTGFYVGGNAGYGFGDGRVTTTGLTAGSQALIASRALPGGTKLDKGGFVGGGQLGYNYQVGSVVLGLETDIQYVDRDQTNAFRSTAGFATAYHSKIDYLGTVRGRIGYAMDRWMIYATGGLAYGEVTNAVASTNPALVTISGLRKGTETGYAVGAGVEYAMPMFNLGSSAATVKVEYLYYDLGKKTVTQNDVPAAGSIPLLANRFENNGHIVRAGLNWKFGAF